MTLVGEIVGSIGPCSTDMLAQILVKEHSLKPDAARKRIQRARASKEILTANFNLNHNQQFVYLKRHEGTKLLRTNLLSTINRTNSALRFPLSGIKARGGLIPKSLFPIFSGLPSSGRKPHLKDALEVLLEVGMLQENKPFEAYQLDPLFLNSPLEANKMNSRLSGEQTVIAAFSDWLKLQGLISKEGVNFRHEDSPPQFGFFHWDLKALCSKYPFATGIGGNKNSGYIVADVILGRRLDLVDTEYFFHKCESIRRNRNMRPFLAWLIADWFEYDVIEKAQKHGVVCTTPRSLFGNQLANLLQLLGELFEGKDFALKKTEDIIFQIGDMLSQFDHLASTNGNLRGALFEVMVGHWLSRNFAGTVRYGRLLKAKNDIAYDSEVLLENPGLSLKAYECKNQSRVSLDDVKHWFSNGVAGIRNHYLTESKDKYPQQEFGIWTTGRLDEDALAWLLKHKNECKKYDVVWYEGKIVRERISSLNEPRITRTYDSFLVPRKPLF